MSFFWAFKSLTFKVIIDRYVFISILFLNSFLPLKKDFIYLFLERGMEEEKHQCVIASPVFPTGDLTHNPGMCPD